MAKAFQFRLEVVERLRKQALDRQRRAMAQAVRQVEHAEARVRDVSQQLRDLTLLTRGSKQEGQLDVASLRSQQFHRGWLADQALKVQEALSLRRVELAGEREKLAEATKRLKVMEKLRARQWQRFRKEQNRREQMELDEIGLRKFSGARRDSNVELSG